MQRNTKIFLAGHGGLVGSAILRELRSRQYEAVLTRTRSELDLTRQGDVEDFMEEARPDVVILAAARVGGILANNTYRASFIAENLQIQTNVIVAAHRAGVKRLLFLGSSCIYPKLCPQPIKEEYLLSGALESTNQPYAIAKIAGIELCAAMNAQHGTQYFSVMPTNLYGPHDNFDLETSHVLPALLRRFHEASRENADHVTIWGTGAPRREFLFVDDLAEACIYLLEQTETTALLNIGTGQDISILDLAKLIAKVTGFEGEIRLDTSKPDGTLQKLLDVSRARDLGWTAKTSLENGLERTYRWYVENSPDTRLHNPQGR